MDKKKSSLLIDTDVLINIRSVEPCISINTAIEMIQGIKNNLEKNKILKQIEPFNSVSLSDNICAVTKNLIITYSAIHGLLMGDAFVAATALFLNIQLFTFNKKDFRFITNLKLYEP